MVIFKKREIKEEREKVIEEEKPEIEIPKIEKEIPLFVKLERYDQILLSLSKLKANFKNLCSIVSMLQEIEKTREENLKVLQESLGKLEEEVNFFESQFIRPGPLKLEESELTTIEKSISKLKTDLEKIRVEIGEIVK